MKPYSPERKEALLRRLLPPESIPLAQLAREAGVSEQTLYNWHRKPREQGRLVPEPSKNAETWSSAEKFAIVLETAALNEVELAEFCRSRGLLVEQIVAWKQACMAANAKADRRLRGSRSTRRAPLVKIVVSKVMFDNRSWGLAPMVPTGH